MNMKFRNVVLGLAAASLLAGCGIFERKKADYQTAAVQVQPLEVPPELTTPESGQRYAMPEEGGGMVASYSEYSKQKTEQPCLSPAASAPVAATSAPMPTVKLQEDNGKKKILLGEPFDRSWRKVGLALERARIAVTDKDRSKGIYFVAPGPDKDSKKKKQPDYQVTVHENPEGSEVTVLDQNGKDDAETARLIDVLYQALGNSDGALPSGDALRPAR